MVYVKVAIIGNDTAKWFWSYEWLKNDPVIGQYFLSVVSGNPLLTFLPSGGDYGQEYMGFYANIIMVAWLEAFDEQWREGYDSMDDAKADYNGDGVDCNGCGLKDSCTVYQRQTEPKKNRRQKTKVKRAKSKASVVTA
jgi:hypothetical protein